jgi:hypothetical protein
VFIQSRRKRSAPRIESRNGNALTREIVNERFAAVIAKTIHLPVLLEDMLGEGEGAWDPDPRYPTATVNCIVWLELIIAEIYGWDHDQETKLHIMDRIRWDHDQETKLHIMDRIRYYGGHVAYGLRKTHYIDLWLMVEPEPLLRIRLTGLPGYTRGFIKVRKQQFKTFHAYDGRLYREEVDAFDIDYITAEGLVNCVKNLAPGYYIGFGVAGPYYLSLYGQGQGPMGLVHSLVIKVNESSDGEAVVYHASTVSGKVNEVPLAEYVAGMSSLFHGYALFELDPNWDFLAKPAADEEIKQILDCEATLPRHDDHRKL